MPELDRSFMKVLGPECDTQSDFYKQNYEAMQKVNDELDTITKQMMHIDDKYKEIAKKRDKKQARERINAIIDHGSPFLELSQLAGYKQLGEDSIPSANVVTGIGMVNGRQCMIISNNHAFRAGTYFPLTVKKHIRAQEIAEENNLPCVYLVDSGGAYLPEQDDVFPDKNHFGRIFFNQARMSSKGIPQLAIVLGSCTAGGAYIPSMSDEVIMVHKKGTVFLGGPPLVQAATGEIVTDEDLGGATLHSEQSGVSDHIAYNEAHAFQLARSILSNIGTKSYYLDNSHNRIAPEEPLYSQDELNGIISVDHKRNISMKGVLGRVLDGSRFHEFKERYGSSLLTGFGHLYGHPVGIVANQGVLFSESAQKGAHFVQMCSQRKIPLLFLQNITGFMVGKKFESEGIAKHGAKMVSAVANANVPKITAVLGASYGAGNYGMCGRAYSPRFMYMLPSAKISVMGGQQASEVLSLVRFRGEKDQDKINKYKGEIQQQYDKQGSAYYSTGKLWDDGIVKAADLRRVLGMSLAASLNQKIEDTNAGVFRF
ncbi:methylcrotonoyl-carboxylase [Stylonychia lemnae]|uniref:methylcrotonoyl-CoA carboxylase n=1 Tax=Stylonychia lemnae TaxID=5949 RepID=A0A078ARC6_STYLE|nr:methylcrotonoyl-carboxylase [Stylonychia lemnae]|eukprot:CDW84536.1 methylcrotonoyl-carboxylase [Stylonychia lemnae]